MGQSSSRVWSLADESASWVAVIIEEMTTSRWMLTILGVGVYQVTHL